jgi:hypothetical protein
MLNVITALWMLWLTLVNPMQLKLDGSVVVVKYYVLVKITIWFMIILEIY